MHTPRAVIAAPPEQATANPLSHDPSIAQSEPLATLNRRLSPQICARLECWLIDNDAFNRCLRFHAPRSRTIQEAEDRAMTTLERACRYLPGVPEDAWLPYLFTIAGSVTVDARRRDGRTVVLSLDALATREED